MKAYQGLPATGQGRPPIEVGLVAVIVAVTEEVPRVLTVERPPVASGRPAPQRAPASGETPVALPSGPLDPAGHRTLERALREWVLEQAGLELGYAEQLYTFGDRFRDPAERQGGPRAVSVAYLALVREQAPSGTARATWRDWYEFFPWEDRRRGPPPAVASAIAPALGAWAAEPPDDGARQGRRERADIAFGLEGVAWDGERVLERYELLYEAGLAAEAARDQTLSGAAPDPPPRAVRSPAAAALGRPLALDHRRILATAMGRLRGKITYRPVIFELLPPVFTLLQLQRVVEALAGVRLHKQNFRRLVDHGGLVEGTGHTEPQARGRPAELFRFRREVLRERPAPGVGLPVERRGGPP